MRQETPCVIENVGPPDGLRHKGGTCCLIGFGQAEMLKQLRGVINRVEHALYVIGREPLGTDLLHHLQGESGVCDGCPILKLDPFR